MQTLIDKPPTDTPTQSREVRHLVCGKCEGGPDTSPPWKAFCGVIIDKVAVNATEKCVVCLEMEPYGCPNAH